MSPDLDGALRRARAGEAAAFAEIYRELQPPLLRYLRVAAGEDCEDLAAQVWLEVVERLPRFRGDATGFRGWLFTLARHRALDAHRRRARWPRRVDAEVLAELPGASEVAAQAEEAAATRHALALIASLPPDQAQAVALRVIAGLEVEAVAAVLGKRPGTVRVLCHRGLRRLAERLADPAVAALGHADGEV